MLLAREGYRGTEVGRHMVRATVRRRVGLRFISAWGHSAWNVIAWMPIGIEVDASEGSDDSDSIPHTPT